MCSTTVTTSRARERRTATHRPTGAAYAATATTWGRRRSRRRTAGAATPATTTPHAAALMTRERDTAGRGYEAVRTRARRAARPADASRAAPGRRRWRGGRDAGRRRAPRRGGGHGGAVGGERALTGDVGLDRVEGADAVDDQLDPAQPQPVVVGLGRVQARAALVRVEDMHGDLRAGLLDERRRHRAVGRDVRGVHHLPAAEGPRERGHARARELALERLRRGVGAVGEDRRAGAQGAVVRAPEEERALGAVEGIA